MGKRNGQKGYTLLFVIFLVALTLISTAVVVPNLLTQGRREQEAEMIWRGHQYERAIRRYQQKFGKYPTSVDDLVKATNGVRFLRQAYSDPTSPDGKWRFIYVSPAGALVGSVRFISLQQMALFDQMLAQGMNPACFAMLTPPPAADGDSGSSGSGFGSSGGFGSGSSGFGSSGGFGSGSGGFGNSGTTGANGSGQGASNPDSIPPIGSSGSGANPQSIANCMPNMAGGAGGVSAQSMSSPIGQSGQSGSGFGSGFGSSGSGFGQSGFGQTTQQGANGMQNQTSGFGSSGSGFGQSGFGNGSSGFGSGAGSGFGSSIGQSIGQPLSAGAGGDSDFGGMIIGVGGKVSKESIKVYKLAHNYKQWEFIYNPLEQQLGMGGGQQVGGVTGAVGAGSISNQPGGNQNGFGNGFGNGSSGFGNSGGGFGNSGGGFGQPGSNGPGGNQNNNPFNQGPQGSGPELQNPQ